MGDSGSIGSLSGVSGSSRYDSLGDKCIDLQVVDNDGLADYASKVVTVVEPKPYVRMRIDGTLKENRKISLLDTTSNPDDYGVASRSWTITAVPGTGAEQDSICLDNPGNLSPHNILIKKAGQYDITLRHRNTAGYEDTVTQRITVAEDRPPVADFSTVTSVTRDPSGTAYIILNDRSYSPDSDIISQRKWTVRYDSNNNGSFDDETAVVIDSGNSETIRYETDNVGKYLFELEVKETFGQPTISRFVTESDYMIGNTSAKPHSEKCVEVINIAPVSSFSVAEKSKVDIVVNIENTSHSNSYIQAKINSILIPKLLANNIECCLVVKENRGEEEYNPVYDYVYYMRYIFYTDSNDEEVPVEFRFYKYNIYTGENT